MSELAGVPGHGDGRMAPMPTAAAPTSGGQAWWPVGLAVVAGCALPAVLFGTRVDAWAEEALGSVSPATGLVGMIVGLLALDTVLPVPSSVLATLAGQRLGFLTAGAAILVGLCVGNCVGYLVGRLAGSAVI